MRWKFMIKHQLKIIVSKGSGDGEPVNIAEFKTMSLFKRLFIFCNKKRHLIGIQYHLDVFLM